MARQDIIMDAEYGEVETSGNVAGKTFYECRLLDSVENADNDNYCYGGIIVPIGFAQSYSDSKGIHIVLPYTPSSTAKALSGLASIYESTSSSSL